MKKICGLQIHIADLWINFSSVYNLSVAVQGLAAWRRTPAGQCHTLCCDAGVCPSTNETAVLDMKLNSTLGVWLQALSPATLLGCFWSS